MNDNLKDCIRFARANAMHFGEKCTLKELAELERLAEIGKAVEWALKVKYSFVCLDDMSECVRAYRKATK